MKCDVTNDKEKTCLLALIGIFICFPQFTFVEIIVLDVIILSWFIIVSCFRLSSASSFRYIIIKLQFPNGFEKSSKLLQNTQTTL